MLDIAVCCFHLSLAWVSPESGSLSFSPFLARIWQRLPIQIHTHAQFSQMQTNFILLRPSDEEKDMESVFINNPALASIVTTLVLYSDSFRTLGLVLMQLSTLGFDPLTMSGRCMSCPFWDRHLSFSRTDYSLYVLVLGSPFQEIALVCYTQPQLYNTFIRWQVITLNIPAH